MAFSSSSTVDSRWRPTTNSAISSVAPAPTMCAPRISEYFLSRTTLMNPSACPAATARPIPSHGNLPTWTSWPRSLACASVSPTDATSGWQYVHEGTFS